MTTVDLLAIPAGIYLLWGWNSYEETPTSPHWFAGRRSRVDFNGGTGWTEFHAGICPETGLDPDTCIARLSGAMGSRLVARIWSDIRHPLAYLESTGLTIWPESLWDASDPFVVNDELAYAVWTGADSKVLRFSGSDWLPMLEVLPYDLPYSLITAIWADSSNLFMAGERGTVLSLEGTGWRNHILGTTEDITALWGFGADNVWAADKAGGLFRWDGTTWENIVWPNEAALAGDTCAEPGWITGMWGADDTLFLHTGHEIARWQGGAFEVLGYWPGHRDASTGACTDGIGIMRVRGLDPTDVFFAAAELTGSGDAIDEGEYNCVSRPFVLWWDGAALHWI